MDDLFSFCRQTWVHMLQRGKLELSSFSLASPGVIGKTKFTTAATLLRPARKGDANPKTGFFWGGIFVRADMTVVPLVAPPTLLRSEVNREISLKFNSKPREQSRWPRRRWCCFFWPCRCPCPCPPPLHLPPRCWKCLWSWRTSFVTSRSRCTSQPTVSRF